MTVPNLLDPVPVTIVQGDVASTLYDEDAREPVQQLAHQTPVTLQGQVKWGAVEEVEMERQGVAEGADGYVLFRKIDLDVKGVTLAKNDRFTQIGLVETDVYILKLQPMGHYTDQGGHTLVRAWFEDRTPAKVAHG